MPRRTSICGESHRHGFTLADGYALRFELPRLFLPKPKYAISGSGGVEASFDWRAAYRNFVIEIVRKLSDQKGFEVLPRRWVVERSFGWMMRWRRLVRDYAQRCDVS